MIVKVLIPEEIRYMNNSDGTKTPYKYTQYIDERGFIISEQRFEG